MYGKDLDLPLGEKPDTMKDDDWKHLDRKVMGIMRLTLAKKVAHSVAKETTMVGLLKALSDMYEKPSASNKVHLSKKFYRMQMQEGGSVVEHLYNFNTIIKQLSVVGINIDDEMLALIFLASLPNSWENMRNVISNSMGNSKLKF